MALSGSVNTNSWVDSDDGETRYYTLSWTATQSVANNTSTISWTLKAAGTQTGWVAERTLNASIAGTTVHSKTARVERYPGVIASGTLSPLKHDSVGAKSFTVTINAAVYGSTVNCKASKTFTLDTIPRKSTLSVANGTLGTSQTLTVTRQSTSFTHSIKAVCGSSTLYIKADGSTSTSEVKHTDCSIPFVPPVAWSSQNTTGTSVTVKYTITTYNGSTNIGSNSYTKTCSIPASVKPSCKVTVTDPTAADECGRLLKGISKLKVVITPTPAYGSAIASYKTTVNGSTYTSSSFTTGVLTSSGTFNIVSTVTDKRGRSESVTTSITVDDYFAPKITGLKVKRCNEDGTENDQGKYVKVTFSGAVEPLVDNFNSCEYSLEYKKSSETTYTPINVSSLDTTYEVTDASYIFEADTGSSYDIKLSISDEFNTTTSTTVASTAFSIIHWLASGLGIAFGKIAELTNVMDIGFQTRFMGGILHPVIKANTDLNDVLTPNTYVGANVADYTYGNCPIDTGTFTLEVVGAGEEGQVKQRITTCRKTDSRAYERFYYQSTWGEWVCVSDYAGTLLASPGMYMTAGHNITFSEPVSKQQNGIVLVFSEYYDGEVKNQTFSSHFIPKKLVAQHSGTGHCFWLANSNMAYVGTKYLYIYDDHVTGHDSNDLTGAVTCGITCANNRFVLRYVIGV